MIQFHPDVVRRELAPQAVVLNVRHASMKNFRQTKAKLFSFR